MDPEYVGYLSMAVVLISFTMKNVSTLRIINTIGCILFVIYGIMLSSKPIIITNTAIAIINLYYLLIKKS